jgi:surface protein
MGVIRKKNPNTGEWEVCGSSDAKDINLIDVGNNFEDKTVEGALREVSNDLSEMMAKLDAQRGTLVEHSNAIAWLKENGGGGGGGTGGGAIAPTITSNFEDGTIVTKEEDVEIDIFFTSPNLGEGTAYVIIDNIEVASIAGIKQGNNVINIGKLTNLKNKVSIYVKDRANMISNQLNWTIIAGGIDLEVIFDDTADYFITDQIYMQFNINSASDEPIIMHMKIDFDEYEIECKQGFNDYYFPEMGIGIHAIELYITSGPYSTRPMKFNIVVVSSNSLYVSSTFEDGTEITLGNPVQIQYRISKASDETFTVNQYLDDKLVKVLNCTVGSYYWTLNDLDIGSYNAKIEVIGNYDEPQIIELSFEVVSSGYIPVKVTEAGLLYRLCAKGRTNQDSDRENPEDLSGRGVVTKLHDFNWFTNGWIDGELVCDSNAYVEIDLKPWEDNAIYGSTIEIQYSSIDIGYTDSRIFDYTSIELTDEGEPYKGAYIDIEQTSMRSLANSGVIPLDKSVDTTISYVIDRREKYAKIFVNGICSRAFALSDTGSGTSAKREDFTHDQKIYLNCRKGIDRFGACKIKDVRVYNRVLTDDEIVSNYIAQITDLKEQEKVYNFNFDNKTLPTIKMYGDVSNMSLETPARLRVQYTSPNEDYYGQSFDLPYCDVCWQGTSSLQYVLKNYTLRLKDENMAQYFYTPYPNGVPEDTYCLKADYMESTHSRNVGLAKFVNDCLYDTKNPMQMQDARIRNTVNGFPILLYINNELQGVYNFNLDRYSTKTYGYVDENKTLVYEISANSDTTAGAFFSWTPDSGKDELTYYQADFDCIYPPTRAAGNDNMSELIRLIKWVDTSSDEDFKDNFENYFNKEYVLRYYLYVLIFGAVDSLGKNMKLTTWDGLIWYPQVYDADTTMGLDNTGFMKFDMDIEMGDHHVFNTTGSRLWKRVIELFQVELQQEYSLMRQDRFTVDNIMKYVYGEQISKIPAYYYNKDMRTKYLEPTEQKVLHALHGNSEQYLTKWIRERIVYCDSLMGYMVEFEKDKISLRSSKLGEVYIDIETYIPMYITVNWRNDDTGISRETRRIGRGEKVRFSYITPTSTDQEIIIYGGHYIKRLGDVSNLECTYLLVSKADRLTEIVCHSPNLIVTDLNACTLLQRIDISNSPNLGVGIGGQETLDVRGCKYLRYCNCYNTNLTSIYTMQAGGNLEEIYYPESVQQVQLTNQTYLKRVGIPWASNSVYSKNLAKVQIENCNAIETIHYPFEPGDGLIFDTLRYVQELTIKNSLDGLTAMTFQGFSKLKSVSLAALYNLDTLGFDDMMNASETSTLEKITLSECPLIKTVTFNISSEFNKVEFAGNTVIDLAGMHSVTAIESNTTIKGLKTIVLPTSIKRLDFNGEFGNGESDIVNIWSSEVNHSNDNYQGIDFKDIDLTYLDMKGLKKVTKGLNFNVVLTNNNPNMNTGRDGARLPYFIPEGTIDISNYRSNMHGLFRGVDMSKIEVITATGQLQDELTSLFEEANVPDVNQAQAIINCYPLSDTWDYMFCGAKLGFDNTEIEIPIDRQLSIKGMFKDTNASTDFLLPDNLVDVSELFYNCSNMKEYVNNWDREFPAENEMQTMDCYFGTGGDLELVEPAWGGLGFYENVVSEIQVAIPTNSYTFALTTEANTTSVGYITWGDGTMTKLSNVNYSHTYEKAGIYTIRGHFTFGNNKMAHINLRPLITKVNYLATGTTNLRQAFSGCYNCTSITLKNLNPTDMAEAFKGCSDLTSLNLSTVNTNAVTSMKEAFSGCKTLTNINLSNFDTSNVTDMANMFNGCALLNSLDVSHFVTNKVTTMANMFNGCETLPEIQIDNWKTDSVTSMLSMFESCKSLDSLNMSQWNTEKVTTMANMFRNCNVLSSIDISSFKTPLVTNMSYMFYNCAGLQDLDLTHFDMTNVKNMNNMFGRCSGLTSLNINDLNTINVTNMENLFYGCSKLETLNMANLKTEKVTTMRGMFTDCNSLTSIDVSSFVTDNVTTMRTMFSGCAGLANLDLSNFNTGKVTSFQQMFSSCTSLRTLNVSSFDTSKATEFLGVFSNCSSLIQLDLSNFNTSKGTDFSSMFSGCSSLNSLILSQDFSTANSTTLENMFNYCSSLSSLDISMITTPQVTTLSGMFSNCIKLASIDVSHFVTNNATDMSNMFNHCQTLVSLNISNFNTSKVTNMQSMFSYCNKLQTLNLSNFNTENVATDKTNNEDKGGMISMFEYCTSLTSLDLSNFNTEKITKMNYMFRNCSALESINLSSFNTTNVVKMNGLFDNCKSLKSIDLSNFNFANVQYMTSMFNGCSALTAVDMSGHNTSKVINVDNMFNGFGGTTLNMNECNFGNVTSAKTFVANAKNLVNVQAPSLIKVNIEFSAPNLSNESLDSIIAGLVNTGSAKTLLIGSANVKKLTQDQLTELTARNWSAA